MNTFKNFYIENRERLFGYLLRRTGNQALAADIVQESFTRYLERYRKQGAQPALLFTIGRNLLYDHSRKNKAETSYEENCHTENLDEEQGFLVREESKRVLRAIEQLDEEEQDILTMVVSSGLPYRDVARIMGKSETNIKVKIHRARMKLREILTEDSAQ